jgi:tetratricopeptide (TPR) repeat protein
MRPKHPDRASPPLLRLARALALAATLVPCGGTGRAEPREPDFWPEVLEPGRRKYLEAFERGRRHLERAISGTEGPSRGGTSLGRTGPLPPPVVKAELEAAAAAFEEAVRASPAQADGYYHLGLVCTRLDRPRREIEAFVRARQLSPARAVDPQIAFDLGIAYSKLGQFERAVAEYDLLEEILTKDPQSSGNVISIRATSHGNAAEALMALGRLEESIQRYEDSLALAPGALLTTWGLAVALDRDEQVSRAAELMARVISSDPAMNELRREGVFFVPEGDIHYYLALGSETLGDLPRAQREWELYLKDQAQSPFAPRARAHLAKLGVVKGDAPQKGKKKRLAPVPGPKAQEVDPVAQDQSSFKYRLRSYLYRFQRCYQDEFQKKKDLKGSLRLAFVVDTKGRPTRVRVEGSTLARPTLHACLVSVVKTLYFSTPISGKPVAVSFPIELRPGL